MSDDQKAAEQRNGDDMQSDAVAQANKPDDARAKDNPKAGNILGGVQPK